LHPSVIASNSLSAIPAGNFKGSWKPAILAPPAGTWCLIFLELQAGMKYRFQALAATSLEWTLPNRHWAVRIMVDS